MGDIIKKVTLRSFDNGTTRGEPHNYSALVDTGATKTVISRRVLRDLGATLMPEFTYHDGRPISLALLTIKLQGRRCDEHPVVVMVSDALVRKAGPRKNVILGHDYLQASKAVLRYNTDPHDVECRTRRRHLRRG